MTSISFYTDTEPLFRKFWRFMLFDTLLVLDWYAEESRATTKKRNWDTGRYYSRLGRDRDYPGNRLPSIVLTDEIKAIAKNELFLKISVCMWEDRK